MIRIILALTLLLLIPQPAAAIQDNDTELCLIEAEDPLVQQQGDWTLVEDTENASGEGYLISDAEAGDELGLLFEGTHIEVIYLTGPDYDTFHIEVDNEIVQIVDAESNEPQFDVRAVVDDLDPGFHIIRVIADSGAMAVDGFQITPSDENAMQTILADRNIIDEQGMLAQAQNQGTISVIIGFQIPRGYKLPHRLQDATLREWQTQSMGFVAQSIISTLGDHVVEVRRLPSISPYLALHVDQDGLSILLQLPYVNFLKSEEILT